MRQLFQTEDGKTFATQAEAALWESKCATRAQMAQLASVPADMRFVDFHTAKREWWHMSASRAALLAACIAKHGHVKLVGHIDNALLRATTVPYDTATRKKMADVIEKHAHPTEIDSVGIAYVITRLAREPKDLTMDDMFKS
jgi:hypothetical protein